MTRVESATDQLYTDFDDQLTESHPGTDGPRAAIVRAGLFERVSMDAQHRMTEANRIKTIYDDLLRTIGYSFDEWRVREADVLQRLSAGLGVFLALIGVVTVLDATFNMKPTLLGTVLGGRVGLATAGVVTSWAIGGALVAAVLLMGPARTAAHRADAAAAPVPAAAPGLPLPVQSPAAGLVLDVWCHWPGR